MGSEVRRHKWHGKNFPNPKSKKDKTPPPLGEGMNGSTIKDNKQYPLHHVVGGSDRGHIQPVVAKKFEVYRANRRGLESK